MLSEKQRYQLERRGEAHGIQLWGVADGQSEDVNGGFLKVGQDYTPQDKVAVLHWMWERGNGYPKPFRGRVWLQPTGYTHPCCSNCYANAVAKRGSSVGAITFDAVTESAGSLSIDKPISNDGEGVK